MLGARSSAPSAALGLQLAEGSSRRGDELDAHRWLRYRLCLYLAVAALVGFTGHTGGMLSYGASGPALPF